MSSTCAVTFLERIKEKNTNMANQTDVAAIFLSILTSQLLEMGSKWDFVISLFFPCGPEPDSFPTSQVFL